MGRHPPTYEYRASQSASFPPSGESRSAKISSDGRHPILQGAPGVPHVGTCLLVTRSEILATNIPGPYTFSFRVRTANLFLLFRWEYRALLKCSNTPVLPRQGMNSLPHNHLLILASQPAGSGARSGVPSWKPPHPDSITRPLCLLFCQGRQGEGCEQHTDVGSYRDAELHKCGPGIATMGHDSCLCSSDMITSIGPVSLLLLSSHCETKEMLDSIFQLKNRGSGPR